METNQYTQCYVAFLDMLGFKNLVAESSCSDIIEIFKVFKRMPISGVYLGSKSVLSQNTAEALKMKVMSDSICLYIDVNIPNALLCILASCMQIQYDLLNCATPIFLRGAITRGDIYAEKDVTFGPGLSEAYLMEANNAKYPRIILTKEILRYIECSNYEEESVLKSIIFRDSDAFYAVNYFKLVCSNKVTYESIIDKINYVLDTTTDNSIREKYLYIERKLRRGSEQSNRE